MLLLQATALADTLVVRQVPIAPSAFEQFVVITSGVTTVLLLGLVVVLLRVFIGLRARMDDTAERLDALLVDARAVATSAGDVIEDSQDTIRETTLRIRDTVDTLADRVDALSAMLRRIHSSAEKVAAVAGTAIGGIKLGARALGLGGRGKKRKPKVAKRPLSRRAARRERMAEALDGADDERPRLRRRD
jgi:uncharacterized protein YoxC